MEQDTRIGHAVRNEGGVKPTHHVRGFMVTFELRRVGRSDGVSFGGQCQ